MTKRMMKKKKMLRSFLSEEEAEVHDVHDPYAEAMRIGRVHDEDDDDDDLSSEYSDIEESTSHGHREDCEDHRSHRPYHHHQRYLSQGQDDRHYGQIQQSSAEGHHYDDYHTDAHSDVERDVNSSQTSSSKPRQRVEVDEKMTEFKLQRKRGRRDFEPSQRRVLQLKFTENSREILNNNQNGSEEENETDFRVLKEKPISSFNNFQTEALPSPTLRKGYSVPINQVSSFTFDPEPDPRESATNETFKPITNKENHDNQASQQAVGGSFVAMFNPENMRTGSLFSRNSPTTTSNDDTKANNVTTSTITANGQQLADLREAIRRQQCQCHCCLHHRHHQNKHQQQAQAALTDDQNAKIPLQNVEIQVQEAETDDFEFHRPLSSVYQRRDEENIRGYRFNRPLKLQKIEGGESRLFQITKEDAHMDGMFQVSPAVKKGSTEGDITMVGVGGTPGKDEFAALSPVKEMLFSPSKLLNLTTPTKTPGTSSARDLLGSCDMFKMTASSPFSFPGK